MILFMQYGVDTPALDKTIYETAMTMLDLVGSDISTVNFDPGVFDEGEIPKAQATANISLHGKPGYTHATKMIGRFKTHIKTNIGRDFGLNAYLFYSPSDDRQLYRAKIYFLAFQPEGDSAFFIKPDRNMKATLIIIHGPWQGDLIQLPLTNSHATDTLSPLQIENTYDGTRDNRVYISKDDVDGDLPAPIKLKVTNTHATVHIFQYWVSLNVNSAPAVFDHTLEGEAATPLSNVVTADGSAGNSNAISVANTTDTLKLTWTMSAAEMLNAAGNQFHVFIRNHYSKNFSNNIYWRFEIKDIGNTGTLWKGDQVSFPGAGLNLNIGDYGVIRLPPYRVDRENFAPAGIQLRLSAAQITAAAAIDQYIDSLLLFPVDGFRNIIFNAYLDAGDYYIDDMIEGNLYQNFAAVGNVGSVNVLGNPILIHPNRDQVLYFLSNHSGLDSAETTSTVQAWYRPQRLAI